MSRRRALGRGLGELTNGSFSSIVEQGEPSSAAGPAPAPPPAGPLEVVAVASGKGGTGKSILTSNLGVLLSPASRVAVLDADFALANAHILLDLSPRFTAAHLITGQRTLSEVAMEGPRGMRLIPGGSGVPELAAMSRASLGRLAERLAPLEEAADLLLIDMPSGIDRQTLLFLHCADQVLVVTTEDVTALTDAYALIKTLLARRPAATLAVVVNRARSYAGGLEAFQRIAHVARKFLGRELVLGGIVPFDESIEDSVAARVPVCLHRPDSPAARALASLAARLGTFHGTAPRDGEPFPARLRRLAGGSPAAEA
ncbi:MAG TPA: P-loop NTPase [Candidatus Polarisedimenticolia bacterium]|nr:P-loop NTPase [Candidatus Polarisedimenticolia bacterium]